MSVWESKPQNPRGHAAAANQHAGNVPPQDLEAEASVLGAILLGGSAPLATLLADEGLHPEHFYRPTHADIYRAMARLADRDEPVDVTTVATELGWADSDKRATLRALPELVAAVGNYRHYGRTVIARARDRQLIDAARLIERGARDNDPDLIAEGEGLLNVASPDREQQSTREQRQEALSNFYESGGDCWPWPFRDLDGMTGGGMRREQATILGGWNSHGKSVFLDQTLELVQLSDPDLRCCAYLNEMSALERDLRAFSRLSNISYKRVQERKLSPGEMQKFARFINMVPNNRATFEIRGCSGWSAEEIARDIGRNGWDLVGVDLLNGIPIPPKKSTVEGIDHNMMTLRDAAGRHRCHIIATQHLNGERDKGDYPPEPVERDLRGSRQIADLAHNVMFVYLREDKDALGTATGRRGSEARIKFTKARGGQPGVFDDARFVGNRMRFEVPETEQARFAA